MNSKTRSHLKTFFLTVLLSNLLVACSPKKDVDSNPPSAQVTFYGNYALEFLTLGLKPLTELPPNSSLLNLGGFVNDTRTGLPIKFNMTLIGQFDVPQSSNSSDFTRISGKITSFSQSVNDQILINVSNINLDATEFIDHVTRNDYKASWSDLLNSSGTFTLTTDARPSFKLSCTHENSPSIALSNSGIEIKEFIASCLKTNFFKNTVFFRRLALILHKKSAFDAVFKESLLIKLK
jgi:hypothetical protein